VIRKGSSSKIKTTTAQTKSTPSSKATKKPQKLVKQLATNKGEIDDLRSIIKRDMSDSNVHGLSDDRAFEILYNAARTSAKMVIRCSGMSVQSLQGHHAETFKQANSIIGPNANKYATYFLTCKKKRHKLDYDASGSISASDVSDIRTNVEEFDLLVENWIKANHPTLV
jgi:hypothetical protein